MSVPKVAPEAGKKEQFSSRPNSDLTTKISHFKDEIKKFLSSKQNEGENIDWQKSNFILY